MGGTGSRIRMIPFQCCSGNCQYSWKTILKRKNEKKNPTSLLIKTIVHLMEIFHDFVFVAADADLCIAIKNFQAFYFCEKKE